MPSNEGRVSPTERSRRRGCIASCIFSIFLFCNFLFLVGGGAEDYTVGIVLVPNYGKSLCRKLAHLWRVVGVNVWHHQVQKLSLYI